jgi:uncharacterized protein (TIGR02466 family)
MLGNTQKRQLDMLPMRGSAGSRASTITAHHELEIHPNSVFSAIYYASCPEGSGDVIFEKDQVDMLPVKGVQSLNALTFTSCSYKPVQGMLLIFRSSLRHMVQVGSNTDARVSLSFNFA